MNESIFWSPGVTLEQIEKQVILKAFQFYRGNKTTTANALGIAIRTLDNKLALYQNEKKIEEEKEDERRKQREEQLARFRGLPQTSELVRYAEAGLRMEPVTNSESKHEMPVQKQSQVQKVLPAQAPNGHHRKGR